MSTAQLIDLRHLGRPGVIASYLLGGDERALVDCGPATCVDALVAGLGEHGLELTDVAHLVLTHIHLDHAGAAGTLVRLHPGLQVHVHEVGAPHLVDPTRLERSARRLYGDALEGLFGEIAPVPERNVHVLGGDVLGLDVVPTPGHAWHHVSFFDDDRVCYAGDALGCVLPPGRFLYPAAAPPEVDLDAWVAAIDEVESRRPRLLRLPHFGEIAGVAAHVRRMRVRLDEWGRRVEAGMPEAEFVAEAERELADESPGGGAPYRQLPAFGLTYAGLRRFYDKRAEREGGH